MNSKLIIWLVLALVPGGCQISQSRIKWDQIYAVPVYSTVTLLQSLSIRARHARAFIQDGVAVYHHGYQTGYDQYYPFCYFEIYTLSDIEQTITPDSFTVIDVQRDETDIVESTPVKVAGLFSFWIDNSSSMITQLTIMWLHSEKQPDVKKLVCAGGFDVPTDTELPTIEQIKHTLGDIAQLNIPSR